MKSLDERAQAQEGKFAHNEKLGFEAEAKGSKIFGLWVAEQIGLDEDSAEAYAKTVVEANLDEPGFDDILRKVRPDLEEKGIEISDHILNEEIQRCMKEAQKILMGE